MSLSGMFLNGVEIRLRLSLQQAALRPIWDIIMEKTWKLSSASVEIIDTGCSKRHYLVICAEQRYRFSPPNGRIHECIYPTRKVHFTSFPMNYFFLQEGYIYFLQFLKFIGFYLTQYSWLCDGFPFICCDFLRVRDHKHFCSRCVHLNCQLPSFHACFSLLYFYSCGSKNIQEPSDPQPTPPFPSSKTGWCSTERGRETRH